MRGNFGARLAVAFALLAFAALVWGAAGAGAYIYWANNEEHAIGRAQNDGSHVEPGFITEVGQVTSVAVDSAHVYWGDEFGKQIGRANLDGSGVNKQFVSTEGPVSAIAVNGTYIFWGDATGNRIGRANINGTSPEPNLVTGMPQPRGVAVDGAHVYWLSSTGPPSLIGRATLGGQLPEEKFVTIPGQSFVDGLAVTATNLYWGHYGLATGTTIGRADASNGLGVTTTFVSTAKGPCGVAAAEEHVFWVNDVDGTIGSVGFDGNGLNQSLVTTGAGPGDACGVAVDGLVPSPPAGGETPDRTPPTAKIKSGPGKKLAKGRAKFSFASSEAGSTFTCKLDKRKPAKCRSPKSYSGLKPGRHSFQVWATDAAGNRSAKPAKRSFRVPTAG